MNWAKENPFLAGFILVSVLVLGGLGYYTYTNYASYTELQATYQAEVEKLHGLQNKSPYPSQENLQKIKDSQVAYQEALAGLGKSLSAYQLPLNKEISPQQFQDALRKAVSQIQAKATEAGVKLPDDFYMGFDSYRANLPSQEAAPLLEQELRAIEALLSGLIETKITSISQLTRAALPLEGNARPTAAPGTPNAPKKVTKSLIDLTLSGEQGRVRLALNSLLTSPQFLIVRALKIENSSLNSPGKATAGKPETPGPRGPETGSKSPDALNMLFGRETITAQLRVELLEFEMAGAATPEKSN